MINEEIPVKPFNPNSFRMIFHSTDRPTLPLDLFCPNHTFKNQNAEFNAYELLKSGLCWLEIDNKDSYSLCAKDKSDFYKAVGITCQRLSEESQHPAPAPLRDARFLKCVEFLLPISELLSVYLIRLVCRCGLSEARKYAGLISRKQIAPLNPKQDLRINEKYCRN